MKMKSQSKKGSILVVALLLVALMFGFVPAAQPVGVAAAGCDYALFVADVTVPDGTNFTAGSSFNKTWRLKNIGSCTWTTSYSLVFVDGIQMGSTTSVNLPTSVAPGATVDLTVPMVAPSTIGLLRGNWQLKNASGTRFGIGYYGNMSFWVEIRVTGGTGGGGTNTPTPYNAVTNTPPPASGCDRATFIDDVNVPDGTIFPPNTPFTKTWRIKNTGSCTWTSNYTLIYVIGDKMGGPDSIQLSSTVGPNTSIDISFDLVSPATPGSYRGYWQLKNAAGQVLGIGATGTKPWWVDIVVSGSATIPTNTPVGGATATKTPTGTQPTPTKTLVATSTPTATPGIVYNFDFDSNLNMSTWYNSAYDPIYSRQPGDDTWTDKGFVVQMTGTSYFPDGFTITAPLMTVPQSYGTITGVYSPIRMQTKQYFWSTIGCDPNAPSCDAYWEVSYQYYNSSGVLQGPTLMRSGYISTASNPHAEISNVDLSALAGKDVQFIFRVASNGSSAGDRVLWGNPRLVQAPIVSTAIPVYTSTPVSTPDTRTVRYDFYDQAASATWSNDGVTAIDFGGSDGDVRGFARGLPTVQMENGSTYSSGLLIVPQSITNGYFQGKFPAYAVVAGDHFLAKVGCMYTHNACNVIFRMYYQIGAADPVFMRYYAEAAEGLLKTVDISLDDFSALAGNNVKFILKVESYGSPLDDYGVWVDPRIVR